MNDPHTTPVRAPRPLERVQRAGRIARSGRGVFPVALAGCLALTGCLEFVRSTRVASVCTPEAAREAGDRDARVGAAARESYGTICGVAEASLNRMYADAYGAVPEAERKPGFFRRLLH